MKRFYDTVSTREQEDGWQVTLDGRGLKTVRGTPQLLPTQGLANTLASEWDIEGEELDPAAFPMRDMADYAIDIVSQTKEEVAEKLLTFADTDTLLYRADPDEKLYPLQQDIWEPIVTAFEAREGVRFKRVSGIMHVEQDPAIMDTLRARLCALDPFALAALEAMTNLAASLTIGLSALEPDADIGQLWHAASLEEEWQADEWGRDDEAEERRAKRTDDFKRASEFARLARA
ncbi:MAG: ATP12 family protein [Pseudomonadota bacterium]